MFKIPKAELCSGKRRANRFDHQRLCWGDIIAKHLAPLKFLQPVQTCHRGSDRAGATDRLWERLSLPNFTDRVDNLAIPGTTAQHSPECILNLSDCRCTDIAQQRNRRNHNAGCANAALRRLMVLKALHQGFGAGILPHKPHQGFKRFACSLLSWHQAGTNRITIDQDCAGATVTCVTANFDILGPQLFAQTVRQPRASGR